MKYPINSTVIINNCEWKVIEYRMGRGREWVYTLSYESEEGSFDSMRLNETAIGKIAGLDHQVKHPLETSEGIFIYGIGLGNVNTSALDDLVIAAGGSYHAASSSNDLYNIYDSLLYLGSMKKQVLVIIIYNDNINIY